MADSPASSTPANHFTRGIVCALLGGSLWGFSGSCAQFLLSRYDISPLFITSVRMLGAGLLLVALLLARDRARLLAVLRDRAALRKLAIYGICGFFPCQITYVIVIGYTNAGTATVIQCTGIVFIMLATCILKRRLPRWQETVGLLLACGATWLLATGGDPTRIALPVPGLIWGLANGLSVAFYIMYPKKLLATHGSMVVTGFGMLIGGIAATCIAVPQTSWPALDGAGVAALLAIVVLGTAVAFGLYMQGVADAGAVRAGMLGVSEPVSATLISWLWLGTAFSAADLVGFAMMIAMVLIITRMQDA